MKIDIRPHPVFAAILLMAVSLLPVMALKDISPSNELKYLSIVDEAIENGSIFTFSNHGEPYADKPPFYFWLAMLSRYIFGGHNLLVLSLISFVPAIVTIGVMDRWLLLVSRQTSIRFSWLDRFAGAMMLGTSVMFLGTAIILRMDMLMTMFIVLALYTFYKMYRNTGNTAVEGLLLPFYIFMALFTKGPVGLLMPVLGIFFFLLISGKLKEAGKYLGFRTWGVIALLCALWFTGVWLEGGREYLENLLFHQTFDRAVDAFHHKEPVWYYCTAVWYVLAPYSLLMIYALFFIRGRALHSTDAGRLFCVCVATTFVMLSLFSSKLSVYMLPIVPFIAYYTVLSAKDAENTFMMRLSLGLPATLFLLAGLAVFLFPLFSDMLPDGIVPSYVLELASTSNAYFAASVFILGAAVSIYGICKNLPWTVSVSSTAVSMLLAVLMVIPLVPKVNDYIGYRNMSAVAQELKKASGVQRYISYGLRSVENMDVFLGEDVDAYTAVDDFYYADISGCVLMAKTSALYANPEIAGKVSGLHGVKTGDYTVFVVPRVCGQMSSGATVSSPENF